MMKGFTKSKVLNDRPGPVSPQSVSIQTPTVPESNQKVPRDQNGQSREGEIADHSSQNWLGNSILNIAKLVSPKNTKDGCKGGVEVTA